jgi:hypothetical protein
MSEEPVRTAVERELSALAHLWETKSQEDHNIFLESISPFLAKASGPTRSLTSQLGHKLAGLARALAEMRYGPDRVPRVLREGSKTGSGQNRSGNDTYILTTRPRSEVHRAATDLIQFARNQAKIGTDRFRAEYQRELERLQSLPGEGESELPVDLLVLDSNVGFAELESGGNLDSSNVQAQPAKLVQAGLALGDPDIPLHFCCAYANRGEGNPIGGALPSYFEQNPNHIDGLLVGSQWWERVLPKDVTFDDFLRIFQEVAKDYEIGPPDG